VDWLDSYDGWMVECWVLFLWERFAKSGAGVWDESSCGSNLFSVLVLGPSYFYGVLAMGAFRVLGYHALFGGQKNKVSALKG
jgi:hypothetical protein